MDAAVSEVLDQRPVELARPVERERTVEGGAGLVARIRDGRGVSGVHRTRHEVRVTGEERAPTDALEAAIPAADGHPDVDANLIVRSRSRDDGMDAARRDDRHRGKARNGWLKRFRGRVGGAGDGRVR